MSRHKNFHDFTLNVSNHTKYNSKIPKTTGRKKFARSIPRQNCQYIATQINYLQHMSNKLHTKKI